MLKLFGSVVRPEQPPAVPLHSGGLEGYEAAGLRRAELQRHLPTAVWGTWRNPGHHFGAHGCDPQVAHYYVCEYYPPGNVLGEFP